jgi:tRNA pseudouridine55 synthase
MIGFINVYKPSGMTSSAVVQKIRKKFHISKVGHTGTLDPMASGILPIAVGKATRLFDYMQEKIKCYETVFDFGYTTDTLDTTGVITNDGGYIPTLDEIKQVLPELTGNISQIPPIYSAKNINGERAYDLARRGEIFELKPKIVDIIKLNVLEKVSDNQYKFEIVCGSGTYIRAIARDIASKLDTYACMSFLERTKVGIFEKETSCSLQDILNADKIDSLLLSPINVLKNFDIIKIDNKILIDLRNGKRINYDKINNNSFILCDNVIIGVCKRNDDNILKLDTYLEEI